MSNTKTTILELRQQDTPAPYVNSNGDWETILNEDVDINAGDSIMINQSFLDTAAFPDGTITIPDTLRLRFQNYLYNTKWMGAAGQGDNNTNPNIFGQFTSNGDAGSSAITNQTGDPFVLCTRTPGGSGAGKTGEYLFSAEFLITAIGNRSGFNTKFGGYTVTLVYQAPGMTGAERAYLNIQVPKGDNYKGNFFRSIINITYEKNIDLKVQSPSKDKIQRNGGRTSFPGGGIPISTGDEYHPRIFSRLYTLDAGNYTPQQLCKTINDQLQMSYGAQAVSSGTVSDRGPWSSSQFFVSSDSQCSNEGVVDSAPSPAPVETCTLMNLRNVSEGFQYLATYASATIGNPRNIWIGASQVVLAYNEDSQTFFWEYLHSPLYIGGKESVGLQVFSPPGTTDPYLSNNADFANIYNNGGIIWKSLTAFSGIEGEDSFQDVDFFGSILKFDLAKIYGPSYSMATISEAPFATASKPYWNYLNIAQNNYQPDGEEQAQAVGLTMTGGFIGLDNAIIKTSDLTSSTAISDDVKPFWECVPIPQDAPTTGAYISATNPIFSDVSATHTVDAADRMFKNTDIRSHYLIEIDAKFRNEFLTTNSNLRTMSQVVGKFYQKGGFTQSNGDGFIYTHSGEPMKLSSFKVRILNPDKTPVGDIGEDNTIFMTISRNPNAQQLLVNQLAEFSGPPPKEEEK